MYEMREGEVVSKSQGQFVLLHSLITLSKLVTDTGTNSSNHSHSSLTTLLDCK